MSLRKSALVYMRSIRNSWKAEDEALSTEVAIGEAENAEDEPNKYEEHVSTVSKLSGHGTVEVLNRGLV